MQTREQETTMFKSQLEYMEGNITEIKKRIQELESEK